jgi:hypothetical protein
MTILEALEEVKTNMYGIATQHYASLEEANVPADFYETADYPLQVILPFVPVDNLAESGALKTTVELHFFILNKYTAQKTVEFKAREVETAVIAPMRLLARKFMHKLGEHSILDPEVKNAITNVRYIPAYSSMDADLHGVEVIAQLAVMERPSVCVP